MLFYAEGGQGLVRIMFFVEMGKLVFGWTRGVIFVRVNCWTQTVVLVFGKPLFDLSQSGPAVVFGKSSVILPPFGIVVVVARRPMCHRRFPPLVVV